MRPAADYPTLFDLHPLGTEQPIAQRKITPGCLLPAPERFYVDVSRAANILDVKPTQIFFMLKSEMLRGYQISKRDKWNILHESIVEFCDRLRVKHHIADRRTRRLSPGQRWRDSEILPFPKEDTVSISEAQTGLSTYRNKMLWLLEEGKFDSYQLYEHAPWRISKTSLFAFRDSLTPHLKSSRP